MAAERKIMKLQSNVLRDFNYKFVKLSEVIKNSTDVYDFYRGEIFEAESGMLGLGFVVTDIRGNFKRLEIEIDPDDGDFYYSGRGKKAFYFSEKVQKEIFRLIDEIIQVAERYKFPVSRIYFELTEKYYRKATAENDPKEKGSFILYMFCNENLRRKYCLSEAYSAKKEQAEGERERMKELCGDWEGTGEDEYVFSDEEK